MSDFLINFGFYAAGAFSAAAVLFALGERRDNRSDVPAEPKPMPAPVVAVLAVEPEPVAVPVPAVAPMKVIPPWPKHVDGPEPVPVAWRRRLELESTPMFGKLPDHVSVWKLDDWKLDDPDRTQMMSIIGGVDADDLDVGLSDPKPMPGFEVDPAARRRLSLSEDLIAEVTASLPSRHAKAEVSA